MKISNARIFFLSFSAAEITKSQFGSQKICAKTPKARSETEAKQQRSACLPTPKQLTPGSGREEKLEPLWSWGARKKQILELILSFFALTSQVACLSRFSVRSFPKSWRSAFCSPREAIVRLFGYICSPRPRARGNLLKSLSKTKFLCEDPSERAQSK